MLTLIIRRFWDIHRDGKARQQCRNATARRIWDAIVTSDGCAPNFAFYVRPFFSDDKFAWTTTDLGTDAAVRYGFYVDFEIMLAHALEPGLPLVALSGRVKGFGPGEIPSEAANWEQRAHLLMDRAAVIFAMPFAQPATLQEINTIFSNRYLEKTVFVVPPLYKPVIRQGAIKNSFLNRKAHPLEIYRESHAILSRHIPDLPQLAQNGGVFWWTAQSWQVHNFCSRDQCSAETLRGLFTTTPRLAQLLD